MIEKHSSLFIYLNLNDYQRLGRGEVEELAGEDTAGEVAVMSELSY